MGCNVGLYVKNKSIEVKNYYMFLTLVYTFFVVSMQVKFEVDFSRRVSWVSLDLKFEERSEDSVSFPLTLNCSMTFYFSFEVLLKLKRIQTNIKGGGASNRE